MKITLYIYKKLIYSFTIYTLHNTTVIMSLIQPTSTLVYSPYITYSADIENNIKRDIEYDFEQKITSINEKLDEINKKIILTNDSFVILDNKFNTHIKFKLIDGIISIILVVIIYVKVYS